MTDSSDREITAERDLDGVVPAGYKSPRHGYLIVLSGIDTGAIYRLEGRSLIIGRSGGCDIVLGDAGISRSHALLSQKVQGELYLEDLGSTNGTFVGAERIKKATLHDGERFQLADTTLLKFSVVDEFEENFQRCLYEAAISDALTGTANRKFFSDRLATEFSFSLRHGTSVNLLLLDLDHFKKINDSHGHQAGDQVLRAVGAALRKELRAEDAVARYGGEEFAILTRGISSAQTVALAERIRVAIEELRVPWEETELKLTASIGAVCLRAERVEDADELIARADRALYEAKARGRNRIVLGSRNFDTAKANPADSTTSPAGELKTDAEEVTIVRAIVAVGQKR